MHQNIKGLHTNRLAAFSFCPLLTLDLPATAHHKIDEGAEKGKE
jgi:hypothetical protein